MVEQLLEQKVNHLAPDYENGWNGAHRAAYFGNLRALRALYDHDRPLFDMTDLLGATPIDLLIAQSDHLPRIQFQSKQDAIVIPVQGQLQTWGQNQNYTLGSGSECARRFPEKVQILNVVHSSFSKYHGMCLDKDGDVFSWGVQSNQKGRLGYAQPSVVLTPKKVTFADSSKIAFISTSDNHSLFIATSGRAYVVGNNQHGQLGIGHEVGLMETIELITTTLFFRQKLQKRLGRPDLISVTGSQGAATTSATVERESFTRRWPRSLSFTPPAATLAKSDRAETRPNSTLSRK